MGEKRMMTLQDVASWGSGGTPKRGVSEYFGEGLPWLSVSDLNDGIVTEVKESLTQEGLNNSSAKAVPAGTILIAMYASIGKLGIAGCDCCTSQAIAFAKPNLKIIDRWYLFHYLLSQRQRFKEASNTGTQPNISQKILKSWPIVVPDMQKQKDIVQKLGAVQEQVSLAEQMLAKADELIQSRFVEMFGDLREPSNIEWRRVDDIASTRLGKMLDRKKQTGKWNRKYLGNHNVQWFGFDLDNLSEMDFTPDDQKEFNLQNGDILMCEGGEVGRCAVWRGQVSDCYFQKALHRLRCDTTRVIPDYLVWAFRMMSESDLLMEHTHAVTIAHLPSVRLKALKVPLPPLALQNEFAEFVAQVESLKATTRQQLDRLNTLYDSLAQRYFAE